MEYKDPGRYIPIIYLLYSWGSLFGVPSRVPLYMEDLDMRHRALPMTYKTAIHMGQLLKNNPMGLARYP